MCDLDDELSQASENAFFPHFELGAGKCPVNENEGFSFLATIFDGGTWPVSENEGRFDPDFARVSSPGDVAMVSDFCVAARKVLTMMSHARGSHAKRDYANVFLYFG